MDSDAMTAVMVRDLMAAAKLTDDAPATICATFVNLRPDCREDKSRLKCYNTVGAGEKLILSMFFRIWLATASQAFDVKCIMPISANPTRILKELGDADHLMSVPLVAPSKGYIRHPAEAGFCTGRGSTPKTVTLAAQSLCNGFATLSSLTSSTPVTAAEIFHLMKTKPKSGASYCWLNFDLSKPEDFEASMEKHYHDKTMRGVATKRETVFVLRGPNKGTSRAVVAKAAGKKSSDTKNTTMTVYDGEEMSVAAAALKKTNESSRRKREAREAFADAAIAVAAATAPFQVGQAVRKINTKKNSKAGKTRIVRKIFQNGFFTFEGTGNLQTMAKFMPDE